MTEARTGEPRPPGEPRSGAGNPTPGAQAGFGELPWAAYELSGLNELWGEGRATYLGGDAFTSEALIGAGLERYRTAQPPAELSEVTAID